MSVKINDSQIEQWRKEYKSAGKLIVINIPYKGKNYIAYFRPIDSLKNVRNVMSRVLMFSSKHQNFEAGLLLMNELWLGGDTEVKDSDTLLIVSASGRMVEAIEIPEGNVTML